MIDPTDLPTLKTRLRALLADTPHPAHPHVSPADLTAILDELDAGESERARHAEEVARLEAAHLSETRALDDLRLKEIASLRDQLRRVEGERAAEFLRRTALGGTIVSSAGLTLEQIDIARRAGRMFVTDEGLGFVYVPGPVGLQPYATDGDELREAIGGSIHETMRSASLNSQGGGGR